MEADHWDELATLFGQALALPVEQREAFLDEACAGDSDLRARLDDLLASKDEAGAYFDSLARDVFAPVGSGSSLLQPPEQVSHYEVKEKLGGGGMGVVYKARDVRLDRFVALKFLPRQFSSDDHAKTRFIQEAKAASRLDHANICTIHEIGETGDGQLFIAMAYYDGETIKKKIERGPLPLDKALDFVVQTAQGLAKAHAQGIIHRDVKPANIMVTSDGVIKILDFGLAKMASLNLTMTGMTMGTVAYMSPEQAQGIPVDHRTDFWSLGVVLYEMLIGSLPFKADYQQALVFSILNTLPRPVTSLRSGIPMHLEHLVNKMLAKGADERYQHVDDLLVDLRSIQRDLADQTRVEQTALATLPTARLDASLTMALEAFVSGQTGAASAATEPVKILVVDDEPEFELLIRYKFRKKIRANEWVFIFATDGVDALDKMQANPEIELVLTDLNMPNMDGLTLLAELAELDRPLRAVVVSAYGDMENIRTAMNRGAFDFVTKPIDFEDLETTILKTEQDLRAFKHAFEAQQQVASLRRELEVARRIQEAVVPQAFPTQKDLPGWEVYAFMAPAREVSGDFYDFFLLEEGRLGFVVGSVEGHGVSAALFTVMCRAVLRALTLQDAPPGACLQHMQELLFPGSLPEMTITMFYSIVESGTGEIAYCNAGHRAPYVLRANGAVEPLEDDEATAINLTEDVAYQTRQMQLQPGEGFFLFTDGILKAVDQRRSQFSADRLTTLLAQAHGASPAQVIRDVVREMARFTGEAPQTDDVTLLALRYLGGQDVF